MKNGLFTISLDFELFWGVRDKRSIEEYGEQIKKVHAVVPKLLDLFSRYDIHCTWATVGFLFNQDKNELLKHIPGTLPQYDNQSLDPYHYIRSEELDPIYHFASDLISQIHDTHGQEIATHTYSHFYTLEHGATLDAFEADIAMAMAMAQEKNQQIQSIVFPRNQYSKAFTDICLRHGIKNFRGNENNWMYHSGNSEKQTYVKRFFRLLDAYVNISGHHLHEPVNENGMTNIPASRFLRACSKYLSILQPLHINRIKNSMTRAAEQHKVFHLWWHPHNFGSHMNENLYMLENILIHYTHLKEMSHMISLNMKEIASSHNQ